MDDAGRRMLERIDEDEGLRGELGGEAAAALLAWAREQARAAVDDAPSEPAAEAAVLAVRKAARAAATSGEQEAQRVVALAGALLRGGAVERAEATPDAPPAALPGRQGGEPPSAGPGAMFLTSSARRRIITLIRRLRGGQDG